MCRRKGFRFPNGIPRVPEVPSMLAKPADRKEEGHMVSRYWKALIAFVSILGTVVASTAASTDVAAVWPPAWGGVFAAVGTVLGTFLVWLKSNEATVEEAEALLTRARLRAGV